MLVGLAPSIRIGAMGGGDQTKPSLAEIVVEDSLDGLAAMDRTGRYTIWNRAMERFAGRAAEETLGQQAFEIFPFLRDLGLDVAFERALRGETVTHDDVEHVEPNGRRRVYDRVYMPLRSAGGEIEGVLAIVRDATARYATLDALKKSEASLRMAVEAGDVGLWSWDPSTDAVAWEDTMCRIFGVPPDGTPKTREAYLARIHPDDRGDSASRIARGIATGEWSDEYRILRGDGAVRWVMSKARILHVEGRDLVLGALFDVTERKERDDRQRAAQKLEAIGQLTAGIAHNFNNMLMALGPNLELAARRAPDDLVPLLRDAQRAAQRAADIVRQLMTYAGSNRPASRSVEPMGELVARTVAFSRTTFDPRITIQVRATDGAAATVDAVQIEQALLNLLINARDALTDAGRSSPTITASVDVLREGATELEGRRGDWVRVRIGDNGVGMAPETRQRIYEPFFTTKEAGRGTGLGLATTHGIVRDHGGFITCRSEAGVGTTFALHLPAAIPEASPRESSPQEPADRSSKHQGSTARTNATVLVVDDEAPVRKVLALLLEDAGFRVKSAASGAEALGLLAALGDDDPVGLVLLDVSMPGMPGPALRRRLREIAPAVPVVYLTGHAVDGIDGDAVLQKPVTRDRLVTAVDAALAGRG
jgi:PAS domain S-box-containing protein